MFGEEMLADLGKAAEDNLVKVLESICSNSIMVKLFGIIIFIFSCSVQSEANQYCNSDDQAQYECCELIKSMNNIKISRIQTLDQSVCTMSVYHRDYESSFRRFGFGSDGQVSVFLQPGGNSQKRNSSQSYIIFPNGEIPHYKFDNDGKVMVSSGSGQNWTFNSQSGLPTAIEGCDIKVSSQFSLNDSGFKINTCKKHLVIEAPVEIGGEYIAYPDKKITVRDPSGKSCEIKNSDIYNYRTSGNAFKDKLGRHFDFKMKYKSNSEMGNNLKKLCPSLDLSMFSKLKESGAASESRRALDILEGRTGN